MNPMPLDDLVRDVDRSRGMRYRYAKFYVLLIAETEHPNL